MARDIGKMYFYSNEYTKSGILLLSVFFKIANTQKEQKFEVATDQLQPKPYPYHIKLFLSKHLWSSTMTIAYPKLLFCQRLLNITCSSEQKIGN